MRYADLSQMVARYGRDVLLSVARDETDFDQLNQTKIDAALDDASQTIDSYLAGGYSLPLSAVPPVLVRHCCYLARYFLEENRATDQARKDYEDTLRFLEKVAAGSIRLTLPAPDSTTVEMENTAFVQSQGSVWARNRAKGFI